MKQIQKREKRFFHSFFKVMFWLWTALVFYFYWAGVINVAQSGPVTDGAAIAVIIASVLYTLAWGLGALAFGGLAMACRGPMVTETVEG